MQIFEAATLDRKHDQHPREGTQLVFGEGAVGGDGVEALIVELPRPLAGALA